MRDEIFDEEVEVSEPLHSSHRWPSRNAWSRRSSSHRAGTFDHARHRTWPSACPHGCDPAEALVLVAQTLRKGAACALVQDRRRLGLPHRAGPRRS